MKTIFTLLLALVFALPATINAQQAVTPEYRKAFEEFKHVSHKDEVMQKVIDNMQAQLSAIPQLQEKMPIYMQSLYAELNKTIVETHAKYYTIEDIKAMTAYFASPVGQKELSTQTNYLPKITELTQQILNNEADFDAIPAPSADYMATIGRYSDVVNLENTLSQSYKMLPNGSLLISKVLPRTRKMFAIVYNSAGITTSELNAMIEYYSSPIGQKAVKLTPIIQQDFVQQITPIAMKLAQEILGF